MSFVKFINSVNLIGAIVLLGVQLSDVSQDYVMVIGYSLVIGYNWETYKRLKGLKNKRNIINLVVGVLTILFSGFLIAWCIGMMSHTKSSGMLFWSFVHAGFACSVAVLTCMTLRFYTHRKTHP